MIQQVAAALGIPNEGRKSTNVSSDLAPAFDDFLRRIKLEISLAGDGLGLADSARLAETTMAPETRRLVQLTVDAKDGADQLLDMLLAKKRASDRREWLESKGNLATV